MRPRVLGTADRTLLVVFGSGIKSAVDLLVGIALARLMSQADFGSYRQVLLIFGTLGGLTSLGIPQSLLYFVPKRREIDAPQYVWRAFSIITGTTAAALGLVLLAAPWIASAFDNPGLSTLLRVGCLYPLGQVMGQCLPFLLIALNRHAEAALASVTIAFVNGAAIVGAASLGAGLRLIVLIAGLVAALTLGVTVTLARRFTHGLRRGPVAGVSHHLLSYSLPLGVSSMMGTLNQKLDRFLVSLYFNPSVLAVYSVGALELPIVPALPYTVGRVLIPHFVELDRAGRRADILPLWHRSIIKVGLLLMPVFCVCFALAPDMIAWLYGPAYVDAAGIFRLYLLLLPLRLTSYGAVLQALGDPRAVLRGTIFAVALSTASGVLLIRPLGWSGPAAAAVGTQVLLIVYLLRRIRIRLGCTWRAVWPWRKTARLAATSLGAAAAAMALARLLPGHGAPVAAGLGLFLVGFASLAVFLGLVDREDWSLARRWLTLRVLS